MDKNVKSIDFDDDNEDYEAFDTYMNEDTERRKKNVARIIDSQSEMLLAEIEQKKENQKPIKDKYIKYILKYSSNYSASLLNTYSFGDVKLIYDNLKDNRNFIKKFFAFLFSD